MHAHTVMHDVMQLVKATDDSRADICRVRSHRAGASRRGFQTKSGQMTVYALGSACMCSGSSTRSWYSRAPEVFSLWHTKVLFR